MPCWPRVVTQECNFTEPEVRLRGSLRTSALRSSKKFVTISHIQAPAKITHLSETSTPLTGVCCRRYVWGPALEDAGVESEIRS